MNEQEFVCKDLPASFDGYRIVLFSDLHVGSYLGGREKVLEKNIRMINEQQGDMVVFTGDLQNLQPSELDPVQSVLSTHERYGRTVRRSADGSTSTAAADSHTQSAGTANGFSAINTE